MFYVTSAPVKNLGPPTAMTAPQVEEFVRKARWEVRRSDFRARRSRCLDGRYKPGAGVIAMPGADAGLLAIALAATRSKPSFGAAELSAGDVCKIVLEAVGGARNFSYHTDRASLIKDATRFDGCSHCRLLATKPALFGPFALDARRVAAMRAALAALQRQHVKPDILRGGHDECAVLVVSNVRDTHACEPLAPDELRRAAGLWVLDNYAVLRGLGRRRVFVYQRDLVESRTDDLADGFAKALSLHKEGAADMRWLLRRIAASHFNGTIRHLAPRLPFYHVSIDVKTGAIARIERAS